MVLSVLQAPATTSLLGQELLEANDFTATVEDPSIPLSIRNIIALAEQAEGTNEASSVLVTIAQIPGTSAVGSVSKGIEVYGWSFAARRKSVEGADGQLQATGHVVITDFFMVLPDDSWVESAIQNTFDGANVGNVSLFFLRNVGPTAATDFQVDLTNCRITALYEGEYVTALGLGFDTIKLTYFPITDDGKASGQVAAGFDLTKNAPVK